MQIASELKRQALVLLLALKTRKTIYWGGVLAVGERNCGSTQRKLPNELLHCFWNSVSHFHFSSSFLPTPPTLVSCVFIWDTIESLFTRLYYAVKPDIRARISVQK